MPRFGDDDPWSDPRAHPLEHGRGDGRRGHGRGQPGARRVRRGDVPLMLLAALRDGPAHGYELIRRLEERSGGLWRPSPGSVYPTLQMLEEQGLVVAREEDGKRVVELTDAGRERAAQADAAPPWEDVGAGGRQELRSAMGQLGMAVRQVAVAGGEAEVRSAVAVIVEARQKLYRLLAGD